MPGTLSRYVVCRDVDGELWYWGSFKDKNAANEIALSIGGEVVDYEDYVRRCTR